MLDLSITFASKTAHDFFFIFYPNNDMFILTTSFFCFSKKYAAALYFRHR